VILKLSLVHKGGGAEGLAFPSALGLEVIGGGIIEFDVRSLAQDYFEKGSQTQRSPRRKLEKAKLRNPSGSGGGGP